MAQALADPRYAAAAAPGQAAVDGTGVVPETAPDAGPATKAEALEEYNSIPAANHAERAAYRAKHRTVLGL